MGALTGDMYVLFPAATSRSNGKGVFKMSCSWQFFSFVIRNTFYTMQEQIRENSREIPPKIKTRTGVITQQSHCRVITQNTRNHYLKERTALPSPSVNFHSSQGTETTGTSTDGWMNKKKNAVHTRGRMLISHKVEGNPATCDSSDEPGGRSAK